MKKNIRQALTLFAAMTFTAALMTGCGRPTVVEKADLEAAKETVEEIVSEDAKDKKEEVSEKVEEKKEEVSEKVEDKKEEVESKIKESNEAIISKVENSGISAAGELKSNESSLPAYEYPGPEQFYTVVYQYIIDEFGSMYLPGDVCIPCPIEVYLDESDKSDIKLYGDFWVFNYTLSTDGETLMTVSGGSHPGLMHLALADVGGYEVTGFDAVEDGSNFTPTAKKIFGDYYDAFIKVNSDQDKREEIRAQIISNYAAANDLPITGYQDYGWEKKALPTENIDSFYSDM